MAVRSISIASDGSLVVAANSSGTCYVWKLQRGAKTTAHFEPLHKLHAHNGQGPARVDHSTSFHVIPRHSTSSIALENLVS